ncbi:hypothetical protein PMZ80_001263 [Knufia obscura]|uniref:DUF8212 domain-containing protein n=1 Tax=Knufia obscura TaxID=1635080 RepID=A0ABR0S2S5_9EURO|nr:hypothetical protein PMZ80_001263 [Knufia obscura]
MYHWYQEATECYAFLSDVHVPKVSSKQDQKVFTASTWFTRGWTLQELIAPSRVYFYNSRWVYLGSKDGLCALLRDITKISPDVLSGAVKPSECAISQRMPWAADRTTSRLEDRAYSLLGIFGVNMPMLYGEGDRAFRRLQEEIIKQSDDHTVFAWRDQNFAKSVLAPSPSCFRGLDDMTRIFPTNDTTQGYTLVNAGLSIQLLLIPWSMNTYIASLRCGYLKLPTQSPNRISSRGYERACIYLQQTEHDNQFTRVCVDGKDLKVLDGDAFARMRDEFGIRERQILVRQPNGSTPLKPHDTSLYGFELSFRHRGMFIRDDGTSASRPRSSDVLCYHEWKVDKPILVIHNGKRHTAGILRLSGYHNGLFLYLGFDLDFAPLCLVTSRTARSNTLSRRLSLLPNFDTVNEDEAMRLLDLNWVRNEVEHGAQYGETVLAWRGDRRTKTTLQCRSLSLTLTFEWKRSKVVNMNAWHVDFDQIRGGSSEFSDARGSEDFVSTAAPVPSASVPRLPGPLNSTGNASNMSDQSDVTVHERPRGSLFTYPPPRSPVSLQPSDVTVGVTRLPTQQVGTPSLLSNRRAASRLR